MTLRLQPAQVVILAGVVAALHLTKLIPALPLLQQQMGLSLVQAGFLLSAVQMSGMALGLAMGLAADRLGLRRSLLLGLVTLTLASSVGTWATGAWALMALRVIEGLGFLLAVTPAPGLIRRMVTPQHLGKQLGLWGAYMPTATALALWCGPLVMVAIGWQGLWWLLAGLTAALVWWVWRVVPSDTASLPVTQKPANLASPLRRTLTHPGPWLVALCFAVYSFQWLAVIGFLPTIYAQAGVAVATTAALTGIVAAVNMVGNIVSGRLLGLGKLPQHLLYWGYAAMALSAMLAFTDKPVSWGADLRFSLQFTGVLLFSMVGGVIPGTLFSLAVKLAPDESTVSSTVGWMQQGSATGQFIGPPLVAWLASRVGGWQWTWLITGACALAGLFLARRVGPLLAASSARVGADSAAASTSVTNTASNAGAMSGATPASPSKSSGP